MMDQISRIAGTSRTATQFKFDENRVNVQNDYIACDFDHLEGSLEESERSLKQVKSDFLKWLIDKNILKQRGEGGKFIRNPKWDIQTDGNSLVLGIKLSDLNLNKQQVKDIMNNNNVSIEDREEQYSKYNEQKEQFSVDQVRKQFGKQIIQDILSNWN